MKAIRREPIILVVCGKAPIHPSLFVSVFLSQTKSKERNLNVISVLVCGTFYADGTDYHDDRGWLI